MLGTWLLLAGAIVFEVVGTTSMKLSQGFTRLVPSIMIFCFYGLSFALLTLALKSLQVSTVYAIWSGLGTSLIAVIGVLYFSEDMSWAKAFGIALVISGVVLINLGEARP
jgi:small multidrug resistance pump